MDAVIYTRDDGEYAALCAMLREELPGVEVRRDPLDGHGHYRHAYDVVVVALEGAEGLNTVTEWAERDPRARILWITGDAGFSLSAIRLRIYGFFRRPSNPEAFRQALREISRAEPVQPRWHYSPGSNELQEVTI